MLLIIAGFAVYIYRDVGSRGTFPGLAAGSYVGEISGLSTSAPQQSYPFYVERLSSNAATIVVVFKKDWQPQLISLETPENVTAGNSAQAVVKPLTIKDGEASYSISGKAWLGTFRGEVQGGVKPGSWSLSPISREALSVELDKISGEQEAFERWMVVRDKFLLMESQVRQTDVAVREAVEKSSKLALLLEEEKTLRNRAAARRAALAQQITQLGTNQEESEQALINLVKELELLGRITKRGKAVAMARRVATRENNWYLANWRAEEDSSGLEEFLLGSGTIDLKQVEGEIRRAEEKRTLLAEINAERRKISQLETKLSESSEPNELGDQVDRPAQPEAMPPRERPNLWDRIWG